MKGLVVPLRLAADLGVRPAGGAALPGVLDKELGSPHDGHVARVIGVRVSIAGRVRIRQRLHATRMIRRSGSGQAKEWSHTDAK